MSVHLPANVLKALAESQWAGRRPSITDATRADCRDAIAVVEAALVPAARAEIVAQLARLARHFRTQRSEPEWASLYRDYADDLAGIPPDILREGIVAYRRRGKWWPKVAELLEIMRPALAARRLQLRRLHILAAQTPTRRGPGEREEIAHGG
jgi:hypothetical protein